MDKGDIKAVLNMPSAPLVEFFLQQANLTDSERDIIMRCVKQEKSQEQAAEELFTSVKTVHRRYKAGMEKLGAYLDGMRWLLEKIIDKGA